MIHGSSSWTCESTSVHGSHPTRPAGLPCGDHPVAASQLGGVEALVGQRQQRLRLGRLGGVGNAQAHGDAQVRRDARPAVVGHGLAHPFGDVGGTLARGAGRTPGLGLSGMKERVALLGGTIAIESSRGKGSTIFVQIPLGAPEAVA